MCQATHGLHIPFCINERCTWRKSVYLLLDWNSVGSMCHDSLQQVPCRARMAQRAYIFRNTALSYGFAPEAHPVTGFGVERHARARTSTHGQATFGQGTSLSNLLALLLRHQGDRQRKWVIVTFDEPISLVDSGCISGRAHCLFR